MAIKRRNFALFFDRSFSKGVVKQIIWLATVMLAFYLILVALSVVGVFFANDSLEGDARWSDVAFLLVAQGEAYNQLSSPLLAIIVFIGLAVCSGMLISVLTNVLERRMERYGRGETSYKVERHVVILGFNRSVPSLLKRIHSEHPDSFLLLMTDRPTSDIREWIRASVEENVEKQLVIMNGDRTVKDDLRRLYLNRGVKEIYILGEENETGHDDKSLFCVKLISSLLWKHLRQVNMQPKCYVQVDSETVFSMLQQSEFCKDNHIDNMDFLPFNFNLVWSQKILSLTSFGSEDYKPLDGTGIGADSRQRVHLVVVGMTDMGRAIAVNAAHVAHFPNFREGDPSTCTRITFIDPEAARLGQQFRATYQTLFQLARWSDGRVWHDPMADEDSNSPYRHLGPLNFMDIEWEFIDSDTDDPEVRQYLLESTDNPDNITTLVLCYDDSERNRAAAMALPRDLLTEARLNMLYIRQKESPIEVDLLKKMTGVKTPISAFGMMTECYSENLLSDDFGKMILALYLRKKENPVAQDIDEILKRMTPGNSGPMVDEIRQMVREMYIDNIDEDWQKEPIANRWSSIYSANMLFVKLRSLGLNAENITAEEIDRLLAQPEIRKAIINTEHNRWNTEKLLMGFRPPSQQEYENLLTMRSELETMADEKERLKKENMKHFDIMSNARLNEVDAMVVSFDHNVNKELWVMYHRITHPEEYRTVNPIDRPYSERLRDSIRHYRHCGVWLRP